MPGILVWDETTNAPASVELDQYDAALASGRYRAYDGTTVRTKRLGVQVQNTPEAGARAIAAGEAPVAPLDGYQASVHARRAAAFDNLGDKAVTFAEGVADAVTLGLVHERGEAADIRRDTNAGSAFAGQMVGLATSLLNPATVVGKLTSKLPTAIAQRGGERAGRAIAQGLFGEARAAEGMGRAVGRRVVDEAVQNAAVGAAVAVGHDASDALIENKPFTADHIASTVGIDALVGGTVGGVVALLGRAAGKIRSREAIRQQSGILDPSSPESASAQSAVAETVASWESALDHSRKEMGALSWLEKDGQLGAMGPDFLRGRRVALEAAERAANRLRKINIDAALAGDDAARVDRALAAIDDHGEAMGGLDVVMRSRSGVPEIDSAVTRLDPRSGEITTPEDITNTLPGGAPRGMHGEVNIAVPGGDASADFLEDLQYARARADAGGITPPPHKLANALDVWMVSDDAAAARYKEIYGRDWVPHSERHAASIDDFVKKHGTGDGPADTMSGGWRNTPEGRVFAPETPGGTQYDLEGPVSASMIEDLEGGGLGRQGFGRYLDEVMQDPAELAKYKANFGHDYVPYSTRRSESVSKAREAHPGYDEMDDRIGAPSQSGDHLLETENLSFTNAGKRGARRKAPAPEPAPTPGPTAAESVEMRELADAVRVEDPGRTNPGQGKRGAPEAPPVVHDPNLPDRRQSPLESFAYDVRAMAGKAGGEGTVSLRKVWEDMKAASGRVPGKVKHRGIMPFERFSELVGEAEIAGYLGTAGKRSPLANLGDIGDELVLDAAYAGEGLAKGGFGFKDRFNRFAPGKKGIWGHDTIVDGAVPMPDAPRGDALAAALSDAQPGAPKARRGGRDTVRDDLPAGYDPDASAKTMRDMAPSDMSGPTPEVPVAGGGVPSAADTGVPDGAELEKVLKRLDAGPRARPGDVAANKVQESIEQLKAITGGRLGSAQAAEAAAAAGLRYAPRGQLSEALAQIWGLRQLARAASEGAPGTSRRSRGLLDRLVRRSGAAAGRYAAGGGGGMMGAVRGAAGGVIGAAVVGGVAGPLIGLAVGNVGGLVSSAGRARDAVVKAADNLLRGRGSRMVAVTSIAARYSYDGSEPTEDVAERCKQLQNALANPEAIRQRAMTALGEIAVMSPATADLAAERTVQRLRNLGLRAPKFVWDALGNTRPAGQQSLRRFREYEDGTHDVDGLLAAVAAGSLTKDQADALREQHPEAHMLISKQLLSDQAALTGLSRERLAQVEMITGVRVSRRAPVFVAMQQLGFEPPQPAAPTTGAGAVQAPVGTPAQSQVAPGN